MVPIADVKRALAEARTASRKKLEEALAAANGSWVQRVVQLEGTLREAQEHAAQVRRAGVCGCGWLYVRGCSVWCSWKAR